MSARNAISRSVRVGMGPAAVVCLVMSMSAVGESAKRQAPARPVGETKKRASKPAEHWAGETSRPMNVLFIISDDQGWKDIGYHGSDVATPQLDKLARAGVRLEGYYVYPTCSPTRVALLTGRPPSRFGVLGPIGGRSKLHIPTDTVTLADVLKARGYDTAVSGKWHLGLRPEVGPRQYGFDSTYGYLHGQLDQYTHRYKNGDRTWHRNDQFIDEPGHATDLIAAEAVRFIRVKRDKPFFLYVAFSVPHFPLQEPDHWTAPYDGKIKDTSRKLFAASLTHMDDAIGRIVAALDETSQRRNTLIVYTSDNGGQKSWSSKTNYGGRHGPNPVLGDNRPLRGWKGDLYEGGIRVPAFVHWPAKLRPRVVDATISVLDWLPTLARVAGAKTTPEMNLEGQDIWPILIGTGSPTPRTLYWKTPRHVAVRHVDWKLIANRKDAEKIELFNLADDPNEKRNLVETQPRKLDELRKTLNRQQRLDP